VSEVAGRKNARVDVADALHIEVDRLDDPPGHVRADGDLERRYCFGDVLSGVRL